MKNVAININVLDKGYVRLIDHMGTDETVIEAARMSTGKGFVSWDWYDECSKCGAIHVSIEHMELCNDSKPHTFTKKRDIDLLDFMYRHSHMTPFEMCELSLEVQAPIMVFREWHRHRTQCLAGDTVITCVSPRGTTFKRTIKEIFDLKHGGVVDGFPDKHKNGRSKSGKRVWRDARRKNKWRTRVLPNCQNRLLRVLNTETNQFETAYMADVWEAGVKPLWELVVAGGQSIRATAEHPFFTRRGWVKMKNLKVGDEVARMGKIAAHDRPIPPALRSGIGVWTTMMRSRLIRPLDACYICRKSYKRAELQLDHVISVSDDLSRALDIHNLKPACKRCHRKKTDIEQPSRVGMTKRGVRWECVNKLPVDLKKKEMTYDIEINGPEHIHNYVANDLVVHNSVNEFSARYSVMPDLHYVPEATRFDRKVSANKQAASAAEGHDHRTATGATSESMRDLIAQEQHDTYQHYANMLDCGVPKEVARINTPVSRYSKMRVKTDLRNWLGFMNLRMRPNAQLEIVQYANAVAEIIKTHWPRTYALCEEYDLYGVKLSRSEIRAIRATMLVEGDPNWVRIETDEQAKKLDMSASRRREFLEKLDNGGEKIL